MGWHVEHSFTEAAKGTIFDPLGDGSGFFPRIVLIYTHGNKESKASSNGSKSIPGFKAFDGNVRTVFGNDNFSADLFKDLYKGSVFGYSKASHDEKIAFLDKFAKDNGVDLKFMGYDALSAEHGDVQGYRDGNVAKVAKDYKGRKQGNAKLRAVTMHEILHTEDEKETQGLAKAFARKLGDYEAFAELEKIDALYK